MAYCSCIARSERGQPFFAETELRAIESIVTGHLQGRLIGLRQSELVPHLNLWLGSEHQSLPQQPKGTPGRGNTFGA
jgi:hypothetical protein